MAYGVRLKDEATGAIISFLRNSATEERVYNLPDRDLLAADFGLARTAVAFVETSANGGNDSTGLLGLYNRPFATINAALDALPSTGGVIYLGIGEFDAPTDDILAGAIDPASKLKNNITIVGTQRPYINSSITPGTFPSITATIATPTALIGGTIIKGGIHFVGRNRIRLENLGVDVGSAYCTAQGLANGGNCLAFVDESSILATQPPVAVHYGLILKDIVTLGKDATAAFHGVTIGSALACYTQNVHTFFNTWGFAAKTQNSIFRDTWCYGHVNGGMILKGDVYGPCQMNIVDGLQIARLGGNGGGFQLESGTDPVYRNTITKATIFGTGYGVKVIGNENVDTNTFSDVKTLNCIGDGWDFSGSNIQNNDLIGCEAAGCQGIGFDINSTAGLTTLKNCKGYANTSHALEIGASTKVYAPGFSAIGNGGWAVNNAGTFYRYDRVYTGNALGGETGAGSFVDSNVSTQV